jgi:polysaccharide export outer membrane protein
MNIKIGAGRRIVIRAAILTALPFLSLAQEPAPHSEPGALPLKPVYTLGAGDQITVRAVNAAEISDKASRIDPDGNINIPTLGRIHAAGMTVIQLEAELSSRMKVFLNDPQVSVDIAEYRSQPVSIFGEVATPGVHQLQGQKSLIEILALAGGIKAEAGPRIRIARRIEFGRIPLPGAADDPSGLFSIAEVDVRPLINAQTPEKDIQIQPYDVISVPRAQLVYIGGEVAKAGPITLTEASSISIMEALSSSGGVMKTSAPQKARILRPVPDGSRRDQIPVDVAKIMKGLADDEQLKPGDILFIPSSSSSKVTARALEAVIQAGTVILTYGVVH